VAQTNVPLPVTYTQELSREVIDPNTFIPVGEARVDWIKSIQARSWRRSIRTRFFVANIKPSSGNDPATVTPPQPRVPVYS